MRTLKEREAGRQGGRGATHAHPVPLKDRAGILQREPKDPPGQMHLFKEERKETNEINKLFDSLVYIINTIQYNFITKLTLIMTIVKYTRR